MQQQQHLIGAEVALAWGAILPKVDHIALLEDDDAGEQLESVWGRAVDRGADGDAPLRLRLSAVSAAASRQQSAALSSSVLDAAHGPRLAPTQLLRSSEQGPADFGSCAAKLLIPLAGLTVDACVCAAAVSRSAGHMRCLDSPGS